MYRELLGDITIAIGIVIIILIILFLPVIYFNYYSSCKQAEIYNTKNATEYSCSDFFWAGSQINSETQTINLD